MVMAGDCSWQRVLSISALWSGFCPWVMPSVIWYPKGLSTRQLWNNYQTLDGPLILFQHSPPVHAWMNFLKAQWSSSFSTALEKTGLPTNETGWQLPATSLGWLLPSHLPCSIVLSRFSGKNGWWDFPASQWLSGHFAYIVKWWFHLVYFYRFWYIFSHNIISGIYVDITKGGRSKLKEWRGKKKAILVAASLWTHAGTWESLDQNITFCDFL